MKNILNMVNKYCMEVTGEKGHSKLFTSLTSHNKTLNIPHSGVPSRKNIRKTIVDLI